MAGNYSYKNYIEELERHGSATALIDGATNESLTYSQLAD